ncbi:TPA: hypothetical protein ACGO5A_001050 [Streptococcus suis]
MTIKLSDFFTFIFLLNVSLQIYNNSLLTPSSGIQFVVILCGLLLQLYVMTFERRLKIYLFQLLLLIFGILNMIIIKNIQISQLFHVVFVSSPAALFLVSNRFNKRMIWMFSIAFLFMILYRTMIYYGSYSFFPRVSRNYISIFLYWGLFLNLISKKKSDLPPIILSFIVLIGCLLAIGRSGILTGTILFSSYFYLSLINEKVWKKLLYIIPLVGIVYVLASNIDVISHTVLSRFIQKDMSVINSNYQRWLIFEVFIDNINDNFLNLIFGVPVSAFTNIGIVHTHNSFLQFHLMFGIMPLFCLIILILRGLFEMKRNKKMVLLIFSIVIIIRSLTDIMFPGMLFEIGFFYIVYYGLVRHQYESGK